MITTPHRVWWVLLLSLTGQSAFAQIEPNENPNILRVKTYEGRLTGYKRIEGVVGKIDADGMTLLEVVEKTGEVREHLFAPHDMLRAGKLHGSAYGASTYLWSDVKVSDTVSLAVNLDKVDQLMYCTEIHIMKRPKGKLPLCQKPDEFPNFGSFQIFNDLDNGEDVNDDEIKKWFPPRARQDKGDGWVIPAYPGGLPKDWKAKLDAIRAKKKDEVKAKPPEKRDK